MEPSFIKISALLLNEKHQLLVARGKGDIFYKAFGGKIDDGETEMECLAREVQEEGCVKLKAARFYLESPIVQVHGKPDKALKAKFYIIEVEGEPRTNPEDKIEELLWISKSDITSGKYEIASALRNYAIPKLIQDGLLQ